MTDSPDTHAAPSPKTRLLVGGLVILACLGLLVWLSGTLSLDFYRSVGDFLPDAEAHDGDTIRLRGIVLADSVQHNAKELDTEFLLADKTESIRVTYHGVLPSSFEPGKDLVVQGVYDGERKLVVANELMFKCPSKYEEEKGSY